MKIATILCLLISSAAWAQEWTAPVEVRMDLEKCVSYQARLDGDLLTVRATHEPGWHTYAMDNELRAQERLAGKKALGIDMPTTIRVSGGLEVAGPWRQSEPTDLSRPEMRWYTWGYDDPALFAAKVRRSGDGPAVIAIRGQACTATQCKNIDIELPLPVQAKLAAGSGKAPAGLVEVRVQ